MSDETTEIQVRAMSAADRRDLHEIRTDPRACRGTLRLPFQSEEGGEYVDARVMPGTRMRN